MSRQTTFEKDFGSVKISFPKLDYFWHKEQKSWMIKGELDICDVKGEYWNTFDIAILIPESYPYCVPLVIEMSQIIPREEDWHVSKEGVCCVDFDNKLITMSRVGINIEKFISDIVYPFFANQLFKLESQKYAGEEYGHHVDGLIQYYIEDLKFPSAQSALAVLKNILDQADLTRNRFCPCGSGIKIKRCHRIAIETLKSLGREKNTNDCKKLEKYLLELSQSEPKSNFIK